VNAHLKRSDNDLAELNATLDKITKDAQFFAPTITTLPRQQQEDTPKASTLTSASTAATTPEAESNSSSPSHMTSYVNYSADKEENWVPIFHNVLLCWLPQPLFLLPLSAKCEFVLIFR